MSVSKTFEKAIRSQLNANAAWFPVTNTFRLGDYGLFDGGIFKEMGNIFDEYPELEKHEEAGQETDINFMSSGVSEIKMGADGTIVDSFAALGDGEASLKFVMSNDDSVIVKAKLSVVKLKNVNRLGTQLSAKNNWRKKFKVISSIYTGENCIIVCSKSGGTEFSISARANVLKALEGGSLSGGFSTNSNRENLFEVVGQKGVVAFELFKVNWANNVELLNEVDGAAVSIIENAGISEGGELLDDFN